MTEEIQKIIDSLDGDGSVMVPLGWLCGLKIPLGIVVWGY